MKYVILKNSRSVLCIHLPEEFGGKLEIVCLENQTELNEFMKENPSGLCQVSFPQSVETAGTEGEVQNFDGLFIRQNEYFKKILFSDIMWIEASRSYCYLHTKDRAPIIITYPMAEVKKKLPAEIFIQIHRSFIVNKLFVNKFIGNMLYIDNQSLPISRKYKSQVLARFLFLDNIKIPPGNNGDALGKGNTFSGKEAYKDDED